MHRKNLFQFQVMSNFFKNFFSKKNLSKPPKPEKTKMFRSGIQYYQYLHKKLAEKASSIDNLVAIAYEGIFVAKEEDDEIAESILLSFYFQFLASNYREQYKDYEDALARFFQICTDTILTDSINLVLDHIRGQIKKMMENDPITTLRYIYFCSYLVYKFPDARFNGYNATKPLDDFNTFFSQDSEKFNALADKLHAKLTLKKKVAFPFSVWEERQDYQFLENQ